MSAGSRSGHREGAWRLAALLLYLGGCALGIAGSLGESDADRLAVAGGFLLAVAGIELLARSTRIPLSPRLERGPS